MLKKYKTGVTVFTPTYNRCNTLSRLYDSLKSQNDKKFEWLIVDDGSTDDTKKVINDFIKEKKIDIKYIFQENHGKSYAFNIGVKNANYNLFYCVDSDDYIGNDTINGINDINKIIMNDDKIVGLMGYKKNIKRIINNNIRKPIKKDILTVSELYRRYHFKDEIALLYKTNILVENPFPIIEGEKFIPESYLYDKMDTIGKCYFIKEDIYFYEYLEDGYTNNSTELLKKNVNGYILYSKNRMDNSILWENKIRGAIQYNISNMVARKGFNYLKYKHFLLLILTFIPSYLYYLKKYRKK